MNHFEFAMDYIGDLNGSFDQKMKKILEYIITYDHVAEEVICPDPNTDIYKDYYLLYLESFRRSKKATSIIEKFNKDLYELNLKRVDEAKKNREITTETSNKDLSLFIMSIFKGTIELWMSIPTIDLKKTFDDNINFF
ncbi:hypothetical protein ALNOE001_05690 [Candidatus Methanobinarius endosymbioticus]|uniref:Uncharacterized protein n=1 Tax=Candidatus Methanobinarius endosymbioticus TaxID=2006182 RepID=A0A366MDX3_9EURY|nr:hypothetical protein ALNOE001_05690 [Candidatus Methanobinarius endosymbioticus]